jgi:hypothetical protein
MFDTVDIICGILTLASFAYILIDSYLFDKKLKKQRKERNDQRVKEGKKPIDYDSVSGCSGGSSFDSEGFRNYIHRNMGMMG